MRKREILITKVKKDSLAERLGIRPGDYLISMNRMVPRDLIDYRFLISEDRLILKIKQQNTVKEYFLEKNHDEDLGLIFATDCFDGIKRCCNNCIFCFVDQLPKGLRPTLYIKDDDYRLSFLHGNFITLTNLDAKDIQRIITFHLSPIYLSVHATDPKVRGQMLGRRSEAPVLDKIAELSKGGIITHIQVVLCPDINDGEVLDKTIGDLSVFWPSVRSIGIVPVGLTKYRNKKNSFALRPFTRPECRKLIKYVSDYQRLFKKKIGKSFVYLADEFYIKGGILFPSRLFYDDFPQVENGIGIARLLIDDFHRYAPLLPNRLRRYRRLIIATSKMGAQVLFPIVNRLNLIENLELRLVSIPNTFFGPHINVTGLLTGTDLIWGLRGLAGENVLLPDILVRQGTELFLDNMTLSEVGSKLQCKLKLIESNALSLIKAVTDID